MSAENVPQIFTLPLFPLNSVLFPHFGLQLHIFEERYKTMINGCIERNAPFGVILIREGEEVGTTAVPHDIGCVARILEVQRFEDGRMNLLAAGEGRFRLLDYMEADEPYLIGRVEELEEAETGDDYTSLVDTVSERFLRYLALLAERADETLPEVELPDDPVLLAFYVASVAMLPSLEKQQLLEMTDTRARLEAELEWLRQQITELETTSFERPVASQVMVARPVDLQQERWQAYKQESRN